MSSGADLQEEKAVEGNNVIIEKILESSNR
jgi:hypothetical protein